MTTELQKQEDFLYGRDLWYDVSVGGGNLLVTPAGDWKIVFGREALRQSLLRRYLTNPGEWATKPEYGAGVRQLVKALNTKQNRALLVERIRDQSLRDPRVEKVDDVVVERPQAGMVKISVFITPKGQIKQLKVSLEVPE